MGQKPHSQKDRQDEKAEGYVQVKEQDKPPGKQLNEVEIDNLPEKRIQNNDSEENPGPLKKNGGKD